jgi:hypothetical protein
MVCFAMKLPDEIREFFRKQGRIGAAKRHASLTPKRRSEIARKAVETRWAKEKARTIKKSKRTGGTK